jgi:hypothetical protein
MKIVRKIGVMAVGALFFVFPTSCKRAQPIGKRSPDQTCDVVVATHFFEKGKKQLLPRLLVSSRCWAPNDGILYEGDPPWIFDEAQIFWSADSRLVSIAACGPPARVRILTIDVRSRKVVDDVVQRRAFAAYLGEASITEKRELCGFSVLLSAPVQ